MVKYILFIICFCTPIYAQGINLFEGLSLYNEPITVELYQEKKPEPIIEKQAYKSQVFFYSPKTWQCTFCPYQEDVLNSLTDVPFELKFFKTDRYELYPKVLFSTPSGWKQLTGYHNPRQFENLWKKYHPNTEWNNTFYAEIDFIKSYTPAQIRVTIVEYERKKRIKLPTSGTTEGMTVFDHLTQHHGFNPANLAGLSQPNLHKLHALAHELED